MATRAIVTLFVAAASAVLLGQDGSRATIRGRVDLPQTAAVSRRPTVGDLGGSLARAHVQPPQAVVFVQDAGGALPPGRPGRASLDQRDETFVPHVLAITVGTIVDFPNNDKTFHNVFSLSRVRRFDLGRYGAGQSQSVRFDRPGIVRVFCDIHSHMNAFVHVFSHPYFAVTDADGRYRIDGLPPGRYTVAAWFEGDEAPSQPAVVGAGGGTELNFAFR
jgi:plastocyanin